MRSATFSAPALCSALLCLGLMTSGCSHDGKGLAKGLSSGLKTQPIKKASRISPQKAPGKPDVGPGEPSSAQARVQCPDLPMAAYEAVAKPTALPDRGAPLNQQGTKVWVEALEGQVSWFRSQLSDTINRYNQCAKQVRQE
jgi:hypothetical protein